MRIHGVCVVRDEADVIGHSLDAALAWADTVHVLDNGSTDGTWELLQEYAAQDERVVLAGRDEGVFRDEIRGQVARQAITGAQPGDWWGRVDADEFAIDDPRELLSNVPSQFDVVHGVFVEYYFTDVDLRAYEADPAGYVANWSPDVLRYYVALWSEIRFARHRPDAAWEGAWPRWSESEPGAPRRARFRHCQYRSPPQIARRVRARLERTEEGYFEHEKATPWTATGRVEDLAFPAPAPGDPLWKSRVMRSDALHFDARDGDYVIEC